MYCAYIDTLAHCIVGFGRLLLELCQLSWENNFPVTETFLKAWSCYAVNQPMCKIYYFIHISLKAFKDGIMNWDKIRNGWSIRNKQKLLIKRRKTKATLLKELQVYKTKKLFFISTDGKIKNNDRTFCLHIYVNKNKNKQSQKPSSKTNWNKLAKWLKNFQLLKTN